MGFPIGSDGKEPVFSTGDLGLIPGSGRSPGEGNGNLLQYSCLENPVDGGAWSATVHGVAKSWTQLSDFTFFLSAFFWGVPHINGIESSCPFKLSCKGGAIRPWLGIQILQYPVRARKACNCFQAVGEGNGRIPCTGSEDSLLNLCVI